MEEVVTWFPEMGCYMVVSVGNCHRFIEYPMERGVNGHD
jgi:hypothetical protein